MGLFGLRVAEITVHEAKTALANGAYLIDVREDDEFAGAHVPGADHIPLGDIPSRFEEFRNRDNIIVMCRSGARSGHVVQFLSQQGIDAKNLKGGILEWAKAEFPIEQ